VENESREKPAGKKVEIRIIFFFLFSFYRSVPEGGTGGGLCSGEGEVINEGNVSEESSPPSKAFISLYLT
jgi:hypothetical protein